MEFVKVLPKRVECLTDFEKQSTAHPWSSSMLLGSVEGKAQCFEIIDGNTTVGYLVLQTVLDQAELLNIVIFKQYQRRSFGFNTLTKLSQMLKTDGVNIVFLEVRHSNKAARQLYKNSGFQQTTIRPNYYHDKDGREDAILMEKRL